MELQQVRAATLGQGRARNDDDRVARRGGLVAEELLLHLGHHHLDEVEILRKHGGNAPHEGTFPTGALAVGDGRNSRLRPVARDRARRVARLREAHDAADVEALAHAEDRLADGVGIGIEADSLESLAALLQVVPPQIAHPDSRRTFLVFLIGLAGDARHDHARLDGILARSRFRTEHHRVRAVIDRIGHVRHFGARGATGVDHGLQHLGCGDHGHTQFVAGVDQAFLDTRHVFKVHLHAQIASGYHDGIAQRGDLLDVIQCFGSLDFRDDSHIRVGGSNQLPQFANVVGRTNKRKGHEIGLLRDTERHVNAVFLRQRGLGNVDPRQVNALALAQLATADHGTVDLGRRHVFDA